MRRLLMLMAGIIFIWSGSVLAYTINDDPNVNKVGMGYTRWPNSEAEGWYDVIGASNFNTKGINVDLSGDEVTITMYTKFDGAVKLGSDTVYAADLGLDLDLDGKYEYGVVLTHGTGGDQDYSAELYQVKKWKSSYQVWERGASSSWGYGEFYPESTGWPKPRKAWVKMDGGTWKGDVDISIDESGGLYAWKLEIDKTLFGSDLKGEIGIFWATGTCANDVVKGEAVVPIPPTILLLGSGLLGFALLGRRKKVNI